MKRLTTLILFTFLTHAHALPARFTALLDYVQPGPDQGKTGSCAFVAATGAMELLLNQQHDMKDPQQFGPYDLSEPFLIHAPYKTPAGKTFFESVVYKFNATGYSVPAIEWPLIAWINGERNMSAWQNQDHSRMTRIDLPKIETIKLFHTENRWATEVLDEDHVEQIKKAMVKHQAPILINYNDNKFWHVILIVGFDDNMEGECYQISSEDCQTSHGAFYVRDSFGKTIEIRDYDWFIKKANSAFVVKRAPESGEE